MKTKNILFVALIVLLAGMISCKKDHDIPTGKVFNGDVQTDSVVDYEKLLVGTWGVEKIEYYNLDYAGNPILPSLKTINLDPSSTDNGFQMIFREDKTGEIRDSATDTLWVEESSYIVCPDTILVKAFTYYYDKSDSLLKVSMTNPLIPYRMDIKELTNNTFVYENEYTTNYMEKAYLKRLSDEPLPPLESYMVNVSANPANGGTVTGGGTYMQGQTCTVTATAEASYAFVNWTENGIQVSDDAELTFVVSGNRNLVANFTATIPPNPGEVQSLPYSQSFASEFGTYVTYDVLGPQFWEIDYSTAKMTGYVGGSYYANEDWLISSPVAITGVSDAKMTMTYIGHYFNNINNEVTIWASTNYTWGSNPSMAGWTQVPATLVEGSNWNDFMTAEISLTQFLGQTVIFAVRYTSTNTYAGTLEVQSITIEGVSGPISHYSDIVINELNGNDKFIEIYNKGDMDLSLEGMYIMKDDYIAGATWTADATVVVPAHGYVVLYSVDVAADHPELGENMFFNSGLSSKKTFRITLCMPDGTVRDEFTRGATGEWGQTISNVAPKSYARTPDGGDWKLANPTPGEANPTIGDDIPQE